MKIKVVAVILAAGEGRRMGQPKAMLEYKPGVTFLARLSRLFRSAGSVPLAVVGSRAREIARAHPSVRSIVNRRWRSGQFSSVRVGLRAAIRFGADWIAVHPVDMPLVRAGTLRRAMRSLAKTDDAWMPSFRGTPGHPLFLSARAAKQVLRMRVPHLEAALSHLQARIVPVGDPGIGINVNTRAEYSKLLRRIRRAGTSRRVLG